MNTKKQQNTQTNKMRPLLACVAIVGSLALSACQTPPWNQRQPSYGNSNQADPYNPNYGQAQGTYNANPGYPENPAGGPWVEDISGQDAYNPPPSNTSGSYATGNTPRSHVVKRGETLWRLSRVYGTSVEALKSANGIPANSSTIVTGSTIRIP